MKTILLIDDDEMCRQPAAELLRRAKWRVLEAEDGWSGVEMAVAHRPDVILCDLLMPRGNGFQVCRAVRDHADLRDTKIIVLTGRDYGTDRKTAQEAGANDYLVKPIEFTELLSAVERMMSHDGVSPRSPEQPATDGASGDVTSVKFWGVRGSIPTPGAGTVHFGGNTSCVELRTAGEIIILDAGSGLRPLGHSLVKEFDGQPMQLTLLVTHTHWDHIQGFPFFMPAYEPRNRLRILGYEGAKEGLRGTLAGQMESPYFPIALHQMPGNIVIEELKEMRFDVGSVSVEACLTNHPGVCVGYRLSTDAGPIVFMPDNETFHEIGPSSDGATSPPTVEIRLLKFIEDAELLIVDAQYDLAEYDAHVGWGHGCVDEVVRIAISANVKRLFLFHHDPAHDDRFIGAMLRHARGIAEAAGSLMVVEAAREGEQLVLPRAAAK